MKQLLSIRFDDPSYTSWTLVGEDGGTVVVPGFQPNRLLTGDEIEYDEEAAGRWSLVSSPVRSGAVLVGVVLLEGGRTYGTSGKAKKPLWQCHPLRSDLPPFLLAYDPGVVGFSKVRHNRYVSFRFASWERGQKHPTGVCLGSFGEVSSLAAYADYWLTGHGLFPRPKLTWNPIWEREEGPVEEGAVWSLDPSGATVFDDALSIRSVGDQVWVDVCIASVVRPLVAQGLWESWGLGLGLPSNLYLAGDRRLSMFPVDWTHLYSLQEGCVREVVRLRLQYDGGSGALLSHSFDTVLVQVGHNFVYGVAGQAEVDRLMAWTRRLCGDLGGSEEWAQRSMVAYWMNEYNRWAAERMKDGPRILVGTKGGTPFLNSLQEDMLGGAPVRRGGVRLVSGSTEDGWLKLTSPLRRRVDLWNQALLEQGGDTSWVHRLDLGKWGDTLRVCAKLERCVGVLAWARNRSGEALQGKVLGRRSEGSTGSEGERKKWLVYLDAIGWMTWVELRGEPVVGSVVSVRVWYFEHESQTRKKVRLEGVDEPDREPMGEA